MLRELADKLHKTADSTYWKEQNEILFNRMLSNYFDDEGKPLSKEAISGKIIETKSLLPYECIVLGHKLPQYIIDKIEIDLKEIFLGEWGLSTEAISSPLYDEDGYWLGPYGHHAS